MDEAPPSVITWAIGGLTTIAVGISTAVFGHIAGRVTKLEARIDAQIASESERATGESTRRHNDLADFWQALDTHRREVNDAAQHAQIFRERMLTELGQIRVAVAALETHLNHVAPLPRREVAS